MACHFFIQGQVCPFYGTPRVVSYVHNSKVNLLERVTEMYVLIDMEWYQIRVLRSPPHGTVAQLVEHLVEAQGVVGPIPAGSTIRVSTPSWRRQRSVKP